MKRTHVNSIALALTMLVLVSGAYAGDDEKNPRATAQAGSKGDLITIAGTIESVTGGSSPDKERSSMADVLTFRLKPDSGATVVVDAGSKAALERQNLTLNKGDKVTVTGYRMSVAKADQSGAEGAAAKDEHIMATTIQKGSQTVQIERGQSHPHK